MRTVRGRAQQLAEQLAQQLAELAPATPRTINVTSLACRVELPVDDLEDEHRTAVLRFLQSLPEDHIFGHTLTRHASLVWVEIPEGDAAP